MMKRLTQITLFLWLDLQSSALTVTLASLNYFIEKIKVDSLEAIAQVVNDSAKCTSAQLITISESYGNGVKEK